MSSAGIRNLRVNIEKADPNSEELITGDSAIPLPNDRNLYEDDPFAVQARNKTEDFVEFRTMGWIQAGFVATAGNIAIGLLSFPSTFHRLGMFGGVLCTVVLGIWAYFMAWIMVDFKIRHKGVMNYPDVGAILFGKWCRRITAVGLAAKTIGVAGSHSVVGEVALKTMTKNRICGVWWALLIAIDSILFSPSRKWGKLWVSSFISVGCIMIAAIITVVGVAVQDSSQLTKNGVPITWHVFPAKSTLVDVVGAISNIIFSFGGCTAAVSFSSEMREPNDFKKSFLIVQGCGISANILVGVIIYAYGGQYVTSPALTMTKWPISTISYAIAMVTIMISGVLVINVGAKYVYMSYLRDSPLLTSKGLRARGIWIGIVACMWILGFLVSQLISFLNELLTVVAAIFVVWFAFGLVGCQWLYDNHPHWAGPEEERKIDTLAKRSFYILSIVSIIFSVVTTPLGMYSAIEGIISGYQSGTFSRPFSC
ncbi:transmembrane amino acid transporter protein-domain-containing protein [Halenospora varia]|nr:transmembrane amino acid transporter protein-domain-containing protein [Halenospora varia]